ncbi:uncharacterized protein A4U43_C08F20250 [Asparagus officinalis]|uniref:acylamino-acid-releasing enzyme 1-like isoform X2 n=1 Tax=Asparagus officinalis TaxID=4686 RepID=UPI00098E4596|nr:acylamino-acid-releasing enzyme 1-like isoform X2 [Asparagus officinalis]ONK60593.1 uncharacterized protein A4U43_C08F20250 [Asparagus officinalis]
MATVLVATQCRWGAPHRSSPRRRFFYPSKNQQKLLTSSALREPKVLAKDLTLSIDPTTEEKDVSEAKLLQEFTNIPNIDKAWIVKSDSENSSHAMFLINQVNLLANKNRTFILSSNISKSTDSVSFQWSPFPVEIQGASAIVPSPSGSKLLVVRNKGQESSTELEIWGPSCLEKEIHIQKLVHGSLYTDRWFEGISWNHEESQIAYIAEEPCPSKPTFGSSVYKKEDSSSKSSVSWKGQGEWEEDWGETYTGKRKPALFVVDINSGEVRMAEGIPRSLSVGQVVWAPLSAQSSQNYLVFVGWSEIGPCNVTRKLGMKVCYNRPCSLYAVRSPFHGSVGTELSETENSASAVNLIPGMSSAFFPRFSPDGKFLVFLSAITAVDTGAHAVTKSLHRLDWRVDGKPCPSRNIIEVVPVVMCPKDDGFPGIYNSSLLNDPWLPDGHTMILSSAWGSIQVILSINILSGSVSRITPSNSNSSWNLLDLDGNNILAVSSTPIHLPQIKYGYQYDRMEKENSWHWISVSTPFMGYSEKIKSLLSSQLFSILKIPVKSTSENLPEGAKKTFESIFLYSHSEESGSTHQNNCRPLIILIHGGPHSVTLSSYSKQASFLSSLGYNLLLVNYRGSVGFGEESLQSLPGNIGCQDVNDVLAALDYVIDKGLADGSKVALYGSSHGGFLTAHLVGQAPHRFTVAAVRNPVCNLSLMVATTDIPDWCYVLTFGKDGKKYFTDAPSTDHLSMFYKMSPISHLSKVKAPLLFLLGAKDRRVPISNGLQYAQGLKDKGVEVKVIVFPEDGHVRFRPQSEFESLVNLAVWFNKHIK